MRPVLKLSSHFEYLEKRSRGQSEETLLRIREQSPVGLVSRQ